MRTVVRICQCVLLYVFLSIGILTVHWLKTHPCHAPRRTLIRFRCQGRHLITHSYSCSCCEDFQWNRITMFQRQTPRRRFCTDFALSGCLIWGRRACARRGLRTDSMGHVSCRLSRWACFCVCDPFPYVPEISLVHTCEKERPHTEVSDCLFTHVMSTVSPVNAAGNRWRLIISGVKLGYDISIFPVTNIH